MMVGKRFVPLLKLWKSDPLLVHRACVSTHLSLTRRAQKVRQVIFEHVDQIEYCVMAVMPDQTPCIILAP